MFYTAPDGAVDLVAEWIGRPALRRIVEAEGGEWPTGSLNKVVANLVAFSAIWDRRNGGSRLIFKDGTERRNDDHARLVYDAAAQLGLLRPPPPSLSRPDYLLILGGLATGVEPRVRYSAELMSAGTIVTNCVAALTSFRPLYDREHDAAQHYAPDAKHEIDLLTAMLDRTLTGNNEWTESLIGNPDTDPYNAQARRERPGLPQLITYAAKSGDPANRAANTADTYTQFAIDNELRDGQDILIVTSAIYVPFQHMDAVRTLGPFGVTIESVGVPSMSSTISHPPSAYLQEIRSTLRSSRDLLASLEAGNGNGQGGSGR